MLTGGILAAAILLVPRIITSLFAIPRISSVEEVEAGEAALVFGAGLRRDGSPTRVLQTRIQAAADLYNAGKVTTLVMSGENPEPASMRDLAVQLGVPEEAILLDNGGLRTYDTCYRASSVYGYQKVILVTQPFHLPRALYICHFLGLEANGVPASQAAYWPSTTFLWNLRESIATVVALRDLHLTPPEPAFTEGNAHQKDTQ